MLKPDRTDDLRRMTGFFVVSAAALSAVLCAGCALILPRQQAAEFPLSDTEARQAGAMALYGKGLLLESGEGAETNRAREAAGDAFAQAVRLDPDNRRPIAALLSNLSERGLYADALAAAERYLTRHPDDTEIRFEAARAADATNLPARAAWHCAALLAAQPANRELARSLVRLYFQADQEREALQLMRDLQTRFPDAESAALPVQWAAYYAKQESRSARALACIRLALDFRTGIAERAALKTFSGECQLMLGQTNAAVRTFLDAYRENPSYNTPLLRVGAIYAATPSATNRLASAAAADGPGRDTARLVLAATQQALDDTPAAAATLREAYESRMRAGYFPDEGFYLWLASLIEAQQAHADAERLLRDGLAAHPDSHEMKNFLAYMWAEQGTRLEEANRLANQALAGRPDSPAYLDTKGWILFRLGRPYDALQFLLRAAELDREEPEILDHVGDVLASVGRENEAIAFWSRSYLFGPQPAVADKLKKRGAKLPQP